MCTFKTLSDGYKLFRVNPKNYFLIGMVLLALVTLLAREAHALALYASDTGINYFVDSGQTREGFLITTYITDAIKEGDRIWPR